MDQNRRLKQAAEDIALLLPGIRVEHPPMGYVLSLTRHLERLFRRAEKKGVVDEPLDFLFGFIEASTRRAWPKADLACAKGCSLCCRYLWVSVTPAEAFYIGRRIRAANRSGVVSAASRERSGITFETRAGLHLPCPFLEHDACSIYEMRPVKCRMAVSKSLEACRRSFVELTGEGIASSDMFVGLGFVVQTAMSATLVHRGLSTVAYELNAAVHRATTQPELEGKWLASHDVFADLPADPVDPGRDVNVKPVIEQAFGLS